MSEVQTEKVPSPNTEEFVAIEVKPNTFKAIVMAILLLLWIPFGVLSMLVCRLLKLKATYKFPLLFHGVVCRMFGMQCQYYGEVASQRPTMYVANHVSYLDVFVLGSILPGAFVAKSEVAGWPLFGKLAKLQNTLFLERRSSRAAGQIEQVRNHLQEESNVIVFPEGTSTAGNYVARFKSTLFQSAQGMQIQPVSVVYSHYKGQPMQQSQRDHYAWYLPDPKLQPPVPNKPFAAHFFAALGLGSSTVQVVLHPPINMPEGARKEVALACEEQVRSGLSQYLERS